MHARSLTLIAAACLLAAGSAPAAETYKCVGPGGKITYSERQCPGAKPLAKSKKHSDARNDTPAQQDRAKKANRAALTPEARKECDELAATIQREEEAVKAKGTAATPADEATIVNSRMRRKQLKCV